MSNIFRSFASTAEFAAVLARGTSNKCWHDRAGSICTYSDERLKCFAGETIESARVKLATGDAEAAARIKAQGELLVDGSGGLQCRIETAICGCVPSVANYLRGVPNNMLRVHYEHVETPVIDMYINTAIYAGINTTKVAQKAAILANIIAGCESAGVRVNLYAICGGSSNGTTASVAVNLKEADSPLNLLNVGYCICNIAFCRVSFILWLEQVLTKYDGTHGRPLSADEIKKKNNIDGLFFDMIDLVEYNRGFDWVEARVNDYIKNKGQE